MYTSPLTFTGPQNLAQELQLNSIDQSIQALAPEDNFAITQGSKSFILALDYRRRGPVLGVAKKSKFKIHPTKIIPRTLP